MFKPFFPLWNRFQPRQETQADGSVPHPADALLADGLRQQPAPAAGPNFDRNVLAALSVTPARAPRKAMLPRWSLPAAAVASVALTAVLPQTKGVLRAEANTVLGYVGLQDTAPRAEPDTFPLPSHQAWVATLPTHVKRDYSGTSYTITNFHEEDTYKGSMDEKEATKLLSIQDQWESQPDYAAAVLKHRMIRMYFPSVLDDAKYLGLHIALFSHAYNKSWHAPSSPYALTRLAERWQAQEPDNAFFVAMAAALRFEKGQNDDAIRLIKSLPNTRYWNDYSLEESVARFRWETFRSVTSPLLTYQTFVADTFPTVPLNGVYLSATRYAAAQEQAGNVEEGTTVRMALLDLAVKISREPQQLHDETPINNLIAIATAMPREHAIPKYINHSGRASELPWPSFSGPSSYQQYLQSHCKTAEAKWVAQVVQDQKQRQRERSWHWHNFSPPKAGLEKLRHFWMILNLLIFSPLFAWLIAGMLTMAWRLPVLRRREEFPDWLIVGTLIGAGSEILVGAFDVPPPFDGLYHLSERSTMVLAPTLAVLVAGVGYLRLRSLRRSLWAAGATLGGVWLTHVLLSALGTVLVKALKFDTFVSQGYLWTFSYRPALLISLTALGLGLLVVLALWRGRGSTWQAACQRSARASTRVGWCLVLAFSLCCIGVAWQESTFAAACLQQRLSGATYP